MTAIAFCLNKKNHVVTEELFQQIHNSSARYGIDQNNIELVRNAAFSYQGFHTAPEEQGEIQPLIAEQRFYLLWDGRIDNREDVYALLSNKNQSLKLLSDAELFFKLYLQSSKNLIERVIGSYTYIVFDKLTQRVAAGRDPMGSRMLVYAEDEEWLCIATNVFSINSHPAFAFDLNRRTVAQQLAFLYENGDSTFSNNVKQLLPGYELHYSAKVTNTIQSYLPNPKKRIHLKNKHEYVEQFRELFLASVKSRLRTDKPISSMVSGGLDSLPITLCAKQLVGDSKQIHGVTWSFDELKNCDERPYFEETFKKRNIYLETVNCDDAYPFNTKDNWSIKPDLPIDMPFRAKHQRAYERIQSIGSRVCLSGMAGDDLYAGTDLIFWELLGQFKPITAFKELRQRYQFKSSTSLFLKQHLFWYTKLWYKLLGPKTFIPNYMTNEAENLIGKIENCVLSQMKQALRSKQYQQLIGTYWSNNLSAERYFSYEYKVQVRYPLRDRRLVEFMLAIPSEYLESKGVQRPIIREAFSDLLPTAVAKRRNKTIFLDLLKANPNIWNNGINWDIKMKESINYVKFDLIKDKVGDETRSLVILLHSLYFDRWAVGHSKSNEG